MYYVVALESMFTVLRSIYYVLAFHQIFLVLAFDLILG